MRSTSLAVLTAYFNPAHYESRRRNYATFSERIRACPKATLVTVECAFGDTSFQLDAGDATIQVRAEHPLWVKENLLNLGLAYADAPCVAWADCDVMFQKPTWVEETIEALQTCRVVQPWSTVYGLDAAGQKADAGVPAFCLVHREGRYDRHKLCSAGYAWAARRDVLDAAGGFLEDMILGGADHLMSRAIFDADTGVFPRLITGAYRDRITAWCRRFSAAVDRQIGCVEGDLHHLFHGQADDRKYGERHFLTLRHGYDPAVHLRKNADGVNQLVDIGELSAPIRAYFRDRREDCEHTRGEAP